MTTNRTPLLCWYCLSTSSAAKSEQRSAFASAKSIASLCVSCWRLRSLLSGEPSKCLSTISVSHVPRYLGAGGRLLNVPLRNLATRGCWPTRVPSTSSWVIEIAERKLFIVLYCFPAWYCPRRNSSTSLRGAETGSPPRPQHQQTHILHALKYAASVEFRQDWRMMLTTPSERPSDWSCLLTQARRPREDDPPGLRGGADPLGP